MAGYFFDTSALVKRYHNEQGSPAIDRLFEEGGPLVISRLGIVETVSALALKVRTGELEIADYTVTRKKFLGDVGQRKLNVVRLLVTHFRNAERLIDQYGKLHRIRTLDALQLSIALDLHRQARVEKFVCADQPVCEIAVIEGLVTINLLTVD